MTRHEREEMGAIGKTCQQPRCVSDRKALPKLCQIGYLLQRPGEPERNKGKARIPPRAPRTDARARAATYRDDVTSCNAHGHLINETTPSLALPGHGAN